MTKQSDIFGAAGGVLGLPAMEPSLPSELGTLVRSSSIASVIAGNVMPGFLGDGDYFKMPDAASDNLEYFNAAGSLIWARSDGSFAGEQWCGFLFKGALMYVFTRSGSPVTHFTNTIDISNSIVFVGSEQGSNSMDNMVWAVSPGSAGSTTVIPLANGTQVVWYQLGGVSANWFVVTNLVDGSIAVTLTALTQTPALDVPQANLMISDNGAYLAADSGLVTQMIGAHPDFGAGVDTSTMKAAHSNDTADMMGFKGFSNSFKTVYYQNDATGVDIVCMVNPTSGAVVELGPRMWNRAKMHKFIDSFVGYYMGDFLP